MSRVRNFQTFHLAVIVLLATRVANGAVPPSVAVRQQSPDVEQIISQLEAKAAGAVGTWTTKSGRQDVPAEEWTTTAHGREWAIKSLATTPSPSANFSLYCDGEDCFTLPDGVRFQDDTLTQGSFQDFRLSHYLLLLNLEPRQLMGSLGGLTLLKDETVDGVVCAHLQADLVKNLLLQPDKSVGLRLALMPQVDIYVDRRRQSVLAVSVTDPGSYRYKTRVTLWDQFGTSKSWPRVMVGKTYLSGISSLKEVAKPCLTTIERFKFGDVAPLVSAQKNVAAIPFFAAPLDNLRSVAFYQAAVNQNPANLSDRVSLVQAAFNDGNAKIGLETWLYLETQLPDAADRKRLQQVIVPHAAYNLWSSTKDPNQTLASISLMQKLLDDLSQKDLKNVSASICAGWENLFVASSTRVALEPINDRLLDLFAQNGNYYVFHELVGLSQQIKFTDIILPYLNKVASTALPETGYTNSPLSYLVAATIHDGDLDKAKTYLQNITFEPNTSHLEKSITTSLIDAIVSLQKIKRKDPSGFSDCLKNFTLFGSGSYANDQVSSQIIRNSLISGGVSYVVQMMGTEDKSVQELLMLTSKVDGASGYWEQIINCLIREYCNKPTYVIMKIGPLLHTYGVDFNVPSFASAAWMSLSQMNKGYLSVQVDYLNRGLVEASDDKIRLQVIQQIAQSYSAVHEYTLGAQAVAGATQLLKDPEYVRQAQELHEGMERIVHESVPILRAKAG